jgi:Saxitoxin biosynthesis operon protein SxtJ
MQWTDIRFDPPRATLRQFAGLCLVVFGGMALWEGWVRGHFGRASVLAILALAIGPLGLARPEWIRWFYIGWMVLAFPIGWTVSQVLLAVLFYGLFTPIGLIFKLIGRDPLHRARRPDLKSYWTAKPTPVDLRRYFKQF